MITEKKWISSQLLFSEIQKQLEQGRQAAFTVTGMSMWPLLCHGRDQVVVTKANKDNIKIGDIVLYQISENQYILHRITSLKKYVFQTTGDGNCFRDQPMPYSCLIAKVTKIIRQDQVISCSLWYWRLGFYLWMLLYPLRQYIMSFWFKIQKWKQNKASVKLK